MDWKWPLPLSRSLHPINSVPLQGELQQEVLEHVSVEGHRALAHFRKKHPNIPGMTLKVEFFLPCLLASNHVQRPRQ